MNILLAASLVLYFLLIELVARDSIRRKLSLTTAFFYGSSVLFGLYAFLFLASYVLRGEIPLANGSIPLTISIFFGIFFTSGWQCVNRINNRKGQSK